MNRTLVEIVVSLAYFLDASDDTVIDPDASVEMLEYIATNLQTLGKLDRQEFLAQLERLAADAEDNGEDEGTVEFLRSFGEATGLTEDDDLQA